MAVSIVEHNGVIEVSGPYTQMSTTVNPRLNSLGFRWDSSRKVWSLPSDKITPRKRTNLLALVAKQRDDGWGWCDWVPPAVD